MDVVFWLGGVRGVKGECGEVRDLADWLKSKSALTPAPRLESRPDRLHTQFQFISPFQECPF